MIPQAPDITIGQNIEEIPIVNKTYKLSGNRISGFIDGIEAVKQAVFKILQTERYENIIYDFSYGVEFKNLIGKSINYVENDFQRVVTEALKTDSRIINVDEFTFNVSNRNFEAFFRIISTEGEFNTSVLLEV